jgi:adenylate cyclase
VGGRTDERDAPEFVDRAPAIVLASVENVGAAHSFLFADLAGFTALTEAHGDELAADLVDDFCAQVRVVLPDYDAEEVKAIGDALMLRTPSAQAGVRLALRLVEELGGRHGFPALRVGLNTGAAVARAGDWFGATVNLAARVSAAAAAGEVLLTQATVDAFGAQLDGVEFRPRGQRRFKNVPSPVQVYAAQRAGALAPKSLVTDPVCQMEVDPARAVGAYTYRGREHYFCSPACEEAFRHQPARYLRVGRQGELRVSESARERAVAMLQRAYRRGRLSTEELEERVGHAYAARTRFELGTVVGDLPAYRRRSLARRQRRFWFAVFPPLAWLARVVRGLRRTPRR